MNADNINNSLLEVESIDYDKTKFVKCFVDRVFYRSPHIHRSLEVMLVLQGECDLVIRGETFHLKKGDIGVVNRSAPHELKATTEEGCVCLCIQFSKSSQDILEIENIVFEDFVIARDDDSPHYISTSTLMLALGRCYFLKNEYMYVNCLTLGSRLLYFLLTDLRNHYVDAPKEKEATADKRVNQICTYLDEHFTEKISVQDLAEKMQLTPQYISKIFTQQMGISIRDYINRARFAYAIHLIDSSDEPLIDVCYESGFSDYKYMEKSFENILGCSPKEYRKRSGIIRQKKNTSEFIFSDKEAADFIGKVFNNARAMQPFDQKLQRMYSELFDE